VLEVRVSHGPQAIVLCGPRLNHDVVGPAIVQPGEDHQRTVPDISVGVIADRFDERGNDGRNRRAANRSRRRGPDRLVYGPEMIDRGLQLFGSERRLALRFHARRRGRVRRWLEMPGLVAPIAAPRAGRHSAH
jgi:hypothetical protein